MKGCAERIKSLPVIQVKLTSLLECNFIGIEKDICIEGLRPCCLPDCDGLENTTISDIGICLFFIYRIIFMYTIIGLFNLKLINYYLLIQI